MNLLRQAGLSKKEFWNVIVRRAQLPKCFNLIAARARARDYKCKSRPRNLHVFPLPSFHLSFSRQEFSWLFENGNGDAPIRRRVSLDRRNNSGPFLDTIVDDLARIVALFARWIYDDCALCRNRYSGNNYHSRYTHYAVTIFMDASFYGSKTARGKGGRTVGTGER